MSHIDKALKKAQKEKDTIYQRYSLITPAATRKNNAARKIGRLIVAAVALACLTAIVLLVFGNNVRDGKEGVVIPHGNVVTGKESTPRQETGSDTGEPDGRAVAADKDSTKPDTLEKAGQIASNADILYEKAQDWHQKGALDKAAQGYKEVLSIEPEHVFTLNNLGVIYMRQKGNKEAGDMFRKAIDLKADYVDPYYNLACLYSLSGNISKSLYYLEMAVSINNSVKDWAKNDRDLKNVHGSAEFRKVFE